MAKELPYFKFFVSEWTDGDVTLEDYNVQGVFINICAYYWSNNCVMPEPKLRKKFKACEFHIDVLMNSHIIKVSDDGLIEINFLDEQLNERDKLSKQNSINALKRWKEREECERNASASDSQSESDAIKIREEERRRDKIREEKIKGSDEPTPFNFKNSLISFGFKKELVTDWLKVRKTKRATNTETAFNGFIKIVENSPRDKNDILQTCVEKSWTSYNDEWYNNLETNGTSQKPTTGGTRNTNSEVQEYDEY